MSDIKEKLLQHTIGPGHDCWRCQAYRRIKELEDLRDKVYHEREVLSKRLRDAEAEIERLQSLVRSGNDHDEDCDFLNLSGELTCNCSGGRARAKTSPKATEKLGTD